MAKRKPPPSPPPPADRGERTGPQSPPAGYAVAGLPTSLIDPRTPGLTNPTRRCGTVAAYAARAAGGQTQGLPPAPEGSYDTYRLMMKDPTIRLAMAAGGGPVRAARWSFAKRDDDVPDEWRDLVADTYGPIQASLKNQLLYARVFGCRSFEQVFGVRPAGDGDADRIVPVKFKPLRPDVTEVLIVKRTGAFDGVRNGKVVLSAEECLHFASDNEDDNWYGESALEGVRENAWWPWVCAMQDLARVNRRNSSIVPVVKGPLSAKDVDENGREVTGYDSAQVVLDALTDGVGVMVENLIAGADDVAAAPELAKASKWVLESFDKGAPTTAADGILGQFKYHDANKMRGLLVPERTATQGEHGTNAESKTQGQLALAIMESFHALMCQTVSWHSVDRILVWNFGERARGSVFIEPEPLADKKRAAYQWFFQQLLANPAVLDLLVTRFDIQAMADVLGYPTVSPLNLDGEDITPPDPTADRGVPPERMNGNGNAGGRNPPVNGNGRGIR